jgi:hypothetical protein
MYKQTTSFGSVCIVFAVLFFLILVCMCVLFRVQQRRKHKINCVQQQRPKRGFRRQPLQQQIIQFQAPILARPSSIMIASQHDSSHKVLEVWSYFRRFTFTFIHCQINTGLVKFTQYCQVYEYFNPLPHNALEFARPVLLSRTGKFHVHNTRIKNSIAASYFYSQFQGTMLIRLFSPKF